MSNPELDLTDERDREALVELASIVADHTNAAEATRYKEACAERRIRDENNE